MDSTRTAERGFSLLELLVCVGIFALASAAGAGAFAAVARSATPGATRDLALMVAENAVARARAAVAYASSATQDGTALLADRSWALVPGQTTYLAGAQLRTGVCGDAAPRRLALPVAATYDAGTDRFTVVVTYPRDPCRVGADATIPADDALSLTLGTTLAPSVYPPGQVLHRDVMPPARM